MLFNLGSVKKINMYKKRLLVDQKKISYASYQQEIGSKKTPDSLVPFGIPDYITKPTSEELETFKGPEGLGKFNFPNGVIKTPSSQISTLNRQKLSRQKFRPRVLRKTYHQRLKCPTWAAYPNHK